MMKTKNSKYLFYAKVCIERSINMKNQKEIENEDEDETKEIKKIINNKLKIDECIKDKISSKRKENFNEMHIKKLLEIFKDENIMDPENKLLFIKIKRAEG